MNTKIRVVADRSAGARGGGWFIQCPACHPRQYGSSTAGTEYCWYWDNAIQFALEHHAKCVGLQRDRLVEAIKKLTQQMTDEANRNWETESLLGLYCTGYDDATFDHTSIIGDTVAEHRAQWAGAQ